MIGHTKRHLSSLSAEELTQRKRELELRKEQHAYLASVGELLNAERVYAGCRSMATEIRKGMLEIPARVSQLVGAGTPDSTAHAVIEDACRAMLENLANCIEHENEPCSLTVPGFATAIRPPPRLTVSEYADSHREIPPEGASEPGR